MTDILVRSWLPRADLDRLIAMLREDDRSVIGPTVRDAAIVYEEIESIADLPTGVNDEQAPGRYRTEPSPSGAGAAAGMAAGMAAGTAGSKGTSGARKGADPAPPHSFDFASSPTSWKAFTFPSSVPIAHARRQDGNVSYVALERDGRPMAFLGVRACDIAALRTHDKVLMGGPFVDEDYAHRRGRALIVAVECAVPSGTCFCASMGTGPEVTRGYDLALTELDDGYVVRAGSDAGKDLVSRLGLEAATPLQAYQADGVGVAARTVMAQQRGVTTEGLHDRLLARLESERWEAVAERCLACTNCTMVCPTCFCTNVTQTSDLFGHETISSREWASCFTLGFARVAGGNFRPRVQDRYRQWLTHKFATWVDQFGSYGCVGCGRCVTWCPVGIDVREELAAIAPVQQPLDVLSAPQPVSANPGRYSLGAVSEIWAETHDTFTLVLHDLPEPVSRGAPGQFLMLDLPGYSGVPISISRIRDGSVYLTIRAAGASTRAITSLRPGAQVGLRGPVGRGWPIDEGYGRDVVIVAGGIGLAPLRPLIDTCLAFRSRFDRVQLFYGARTPADLLYRDELLAWGRRSDIGVAVTVDRADEGWTGPVGVVTHLFDRAPIDGNHTTAFVCGPERMMSASSLALAGSGLLPERIFLSMERHMECGIGLCGHCQMGRYFICKDGPVFSRRELGESMDVEGL